MNRRDFLKTAALSAVGATLAGCRTAVRMAAQPAQERMLRRPYGRSGERLSVIGFGGILVMGVPQERADQLVAEAVARGVNYFDVAPQYGDAEERLGPALAPYRQQVFLAGKTLQRRREEAAAELERTLRRLRTDHLDLYQLHALTDVQQDVDVAFARGGALELCLEAQADGRVRHLGFSAHSEEAALAALESKVALHGLVVFGSRARGDCADDSDMDVLVVVEELSRAIEEAIRDCTWAIRLAHGMVIVPVIYSRDEWENGPDRSSLLALAIEQEGIPV